MSKARELASLVSNSRDLADGASTGGEFKYEASGAIAANKPLILKSDDTVSQILFTTTASSALTSGSNIYSLGASQKLLDILLDGDYLFVVIENAVSTITDTIKLLMYSIGADNTFTLQQETAFSQSWSRGANHRAWITKSSTANKYTLAVFDSDESLYDGRIRVFGIVNNLDNTFSYSAAVSSPDATDATYPRAGTRPIQMGDYLVAGVSGSDTDNEVFTFDTSGSGTTVTLSDSGNRGNVGYSDGGDPNQRFIVKQSETIGYFVLCRSTGDIAYEQISINGTGQIADGASGQLSSVNLLSDSTYNESDMLWSDTHSCFIVVTNNATTTRVGIYDSSFNYIHSADYSVGDNDEFYRSLQLDESTGRFYLLTHDSTTSTTTFIPGTIISNEVVLITDDILTATYSYVSDGRPMVSLDETNGKLVYAHEDTDSGANDSIFVRPISAGSSITSNFSDGTFVGYSKEAVSDGEYVTTAIDGGIVSLSGLTTNTVYYTNATGSLLTAGDADKGVGIAITPTELRVDTQIGNFNSNKSTGNITIDSTSDITIDSDGDLSLLGGSNTAVTGNTIVLKTPEDENALYYSGSVLYGYYNGGEKVRTDSGGIVVQGYVYPTSGIAHSLDTDNRIQFGTDTQTYQTGGISRMLINSVGEITIYNDLDAQSELTAGSYNETYAAVTSTSNATTVDCEAGNAFMHTLTENTTFTFSNPPASGTAYSMSIEIIQDASASGYTVTWPASVDWPSATAPTLTATASAVDVFVFTTRDGGTTWYGFTAGQALG